MVCGSCGPRTLTVEDMKHMTSEQIIAAYRQGYKLVQGGAPQQQAMSQEWQYGGVQSLVPTYGGTAGTPPAGTKGSGSTVDLSVQPTGGVGPYKSWFYIHHNATDRGAIITAGRLAIPGGAYVDPVGMAGSQPYTNIAEGSVLRRIYTLDDTDVRIATSDTGAMLPTDVDATTGLLTFGLVPSILAAASIRFYTGIVDSCSGTTGPAGCVQWADVTLVCAVPTCGFIVT